MKYRNIIWDWNGTLLNDLQVGWMTVNDMLLRRHIEILSMKRYRDLFTFPVEIFYNEIGFDVRGETMHALSVDFVDTYDRVAEKEGLSLNLGVKEELSRLSGEGVHNYVLSALNTPSLCKMVEDYGITSDFDYLCGSDNIYGSSKTERGKEMMERLRLNPKETLMVGDTTHDAEVAEVLGIESLLFAGGHNSEERLKETSPVFYSFTEIEEYV